MLIYIGIANIIGLFGFKPPTKDLNVTIALAVMSMCLIEYSGIHKNGLKHWVKHFAKPVPFVAPIMVLEIVIRPLSLCMRLFGNVLGAFVIMELLKNSSSRRLYQSRLVFILIYLMDSYRLMYLYF